MRLTIAAILFSAALANAQVAVRGDKVYTMAGPPLNDAVVLMRDGKIERIGPASQVSIPAGYRTLRAAVVTPGLVDAHSVLGLSGYLNVPQDQDQVERSTAMQPELRAIDCIQPARAAHRIRAQLRRHHRSYRPRPRHSDVRSDHGGQDRGCHCGRRCHCSVRDGGRHPR